MDIAKRFWEKVDKENDPNGCWNWLGYTNKKGYGEIGINYKLIKAHRLSYTLTKGEIPEGLVIDHLCKNRRCCNPAHLEAVAQKENMIRGLQPNCIAYRENKCTKGHELTPENTYLVNEKKRGKIKQSRRCRQCYLEWNARGRAKRKTEKLRDLVT